MFVAAYNLIERLRSMDKYDVFFAIGHIAVNGNVLDVGVFEIVRTFRFGIFIVVRLHCVFYVPGVGTTNQKRAVKSALSNYTIYSLLMGARRNTSVSSSSSSSSSNMCLVSSERCASAANV